MKKVRLRLLLLLGTGAVAFQLGGCSLTEILGSLIPGA